jgi:two-component system, NtrC family, sensor kinase
MPSETIAPTETILVVDDNPTNIQVLFDILSEMGYRVAIAKNGEAALQRLDSFVPDIILLDVMMPGIDGFETCQRLKTESHTRDIPVIFMTALSDTVDKVRGLSLGAVDYITKPIQHEEALARIRVHLKLSSTQKALEQQTLELSETLGNLKQAQIQLIQSEKMSSLGQLMAGVAHEINNPVNFIHGNLTPAKEYIEDLISFFNLFCECYPQPHPKMQAWIKSADMNHLVTDLPKLLNSMEVGSDRIRDLVLSLRNFSRLDEADRKPVDIHEGLESTLLILQHRLKRAPNFPGIEVNKSYGDLPLVECYPAQLNQVFMNLLANAIDALEEASTKLEPSQPSPQTPGQIWISTCMLNAERVQIMIADNGLGISESALVQIFDPFFSTKPIGKGTGLGLSISYQIITEKHQGTVTCESSPGQGTKFRLEVPIRRAE